MRGFNLIALMAPTANLTACSTYTVMADPAATLKQPQPEVKQVRLTFRTGEPVTVRSPRVEGD